MKFHETKIYKGSSRFILSPNPTSADSLRAAGARRNLKAMD